MDQEEPLLQNIYLELEHTAHKTKYFVLCVGEELR